MWKRSAAAAFTLLMTVAAAPVRHGGEWETVINGGPPRVVCLTKDQVFDKDALLRQMPNAQCTMDTLDIAGNVITFAMQCTLQGSTITSSGTITQTGPDAFTSKLHGHGGVIPRSNGQTITIPDTDMVVVSRRLGPCKPGDRQVDE